MALWTEFKDFRDDCRSVQAYWGPFSRACEEALHKELEPPPFTPSFYYGRLAKRDFGTTVIKAGLHYLSTELSRVARMCREGLSRRGSQSVSGLR
jgi:hypothetical protein